MLVLCSMKRPGLLHPNQPQRGQGSKKAERIIAEWQHQPKREEEHGHTALLGGLIGVYRPHWTVLQLGSGGFL